MRWLTLLLALAACDLGPDYCTTKITRVQVVGYDCPTVDRWTLELAADWARSNCPEVAACDVLSTLRYSASAGLPARLYWQGPPLSIGRVVQAESAEGYKHELTHGLIDGCGLAKWDQKAHHALMNRCLRWTAKD